MLDIYFKKGRTGFQSVTGIHLTAARWLYAEVHDDRTGIVRDNNGYAILCIHPRRLIRLDCETADRYGDNLIRIRRNGKYGLADPKGNILIPVEYDVLTRHHAQFNIIGRNGKFGLLNRAGEWVRSLYFDSILPIKQRGNDRLVCIRNGKTLFL